MAGWYIRRGEKIVGPVELPKLQELVAAGRLLPTDQLAKDVAGPWKEAGGTTLFAKLKHHTAPAVTVPPPQPPSLVPKPEASPPAVVTQPEGTGKVLQVVHIVFGGIGRGMLATWGAVSRTMATRAQRKHEIKLARIQAEALANSQLDRTPQARSAAPPQQAVPPQAVYVPQVHQTTVVQVVNKNSQSAYGCSGCGVILLMILIGLIVLVIASTPTTP